MTELYRNTSIPALTRLLLFTGIEDGVRDVGGLRSQVCDLLRVDSTYVESAAAALLERDELHRVLERAHIPFHAQAYAVAGLLVSAAVLE